MVTQKLPTAHLLKQLHPGSWCKFKYANQHIPVKSKHAVYDMEIRKFKERLRNPRTLKKRNEGINKIKYINDNIEKEDR